jgi:acyl-CoA reductase-like NAD-dependent aldehyde dehydrogenase
MESIYKAAHSSKEDVALAVDKAHEAFQTWGKNFSYGAQYFTE